jgi:hypothetical protein
MARAPFSARARAISPLHIVQTGSGAHPASYPMGTWGFFRRWVKRLEREAGHSAPSSAEFKNGGAVPPLPSYVFMV